MEEERPLESGVQNGWGRAGRMGLGLEVVLRESGGDQREVECTGLEVGHSEVETCWWCGEEGRGLTAGRIHRSKT